MGSLVLPIAVFQLGVAHPFLEHRLDLRCTLRRYVEFLEATDRRLTVGRSACDAQRLTDLSLRQAQRQSTQLEGFGKLFDFVQIDSVDRCIV